MLPPARLYLLETHSVIQRTQKFVRAKRLHLLASSSKLTSGAKGVSSGTSSRQSFLRRSASGVRNSYGRKITGLTRRTFSTTYHNKFEAPEESLVNTVAHIRYNNYYAAECFDMVKQDGHIQRVVAAAFACGVV
jgi:hypothetical protein